MENVLDGARVEGGGGFDWHILVCVSFGLDA